jgi:hypothetical protein
MTLIKQAEAAGKKAAAPAQTPSTGQAPGTESIKERLYAELAKHKLKK